MKNHLRTALRPRVNEIVTACVQNEIATRVHHEVSICASCDRATESHLACAAHGASPCIAAGLAPPVQASDHGSKEEPPQLVSALIFSWMLVPRSLTVSSSHIISMACSISCMHSRATTPYTTGPYYHVFICFISGRAYSSYLPLAAEPITGFAHLPSVPGTVMIVVMQRGPEAQRAHPLLWP